MAEKEDFLILIYMPAEEKICESGEGPNVERCVWNRKFRMRIRNEDFDSNSALLLLLLVEYNTEMITANFIITFPIFLTETPASLSRIVSHTFSPSSLSSLSSLYRVQVENFFILCWSENEIFSSSKLRPSASKQASKPSTIESNFFDSHCCVDAVIISGQMRTNPFNFTRFSLCWSGGVSRVPNTIQFDAAEDVGNMCENKKKEKLQKRRKKTVKYIALSGVEMLKIRSSISTSL